MASERQTQQTPAPALPPQDLETEQAALGSILLDPGAAATALSQLDEQDFYPEAHRLIYRAMRTVYNRNEPVDLVTVSAELRRQNRLEQAGGGEYLTALINTVPTTAHVDRYASLVAEKSTLRKLIQAGAEIQAACYDNPSEVDEVVDAAERRIFEIGRRRNAREIEHVGALVEQTFDKLDRLMKHPGFLTGVPTGLNELDKLTSGLQPGDLIIVAARPSMGKTSLAITNFALHAAVQREKPVLIFSLEMSKMQLAEMLLCSHARVNSWALRRGMVSDGDWMNIGNALTVLPQAPIYIDDTPGLLIMELRSKARWAKLQHNIELIVVDYLQLASAGQGFSGDNRHQEVSLIARSLKALARELNVPVVALSQLSRRVEQREDKRPILSDLAESGSIEAEADLVCFLYRPQYYQTKKTLQEAEKAGLKAADKAALHRPDQAEIIIAKHRNGPVGTVEAWFNPQWRTFLDEAPGYAGGEF